MITLKQFDDLRKEVQRAALTCKAPGFGITFGVTADLWKDLIGVMDRILRTDSVEYYFYNVPVRLIEGDGCRWVLYFARGEIK